MGGNTLREWMCLFENLSSDFVLVNDLTIDLHNHHYICLCNFVEIIKCDFSIQLLLYLINCYDLIIHL